MENNREQKERERLQKEAEEESKKISLPPIDFGDGTKLDISDSKTRLICKVAPQTLVWTSPERKTVHAVELYWRTKDGNYFKLSYDECGGVPFRIDMEQAHYMMDRRTDYQWFLTDIQKKELEEEDERMSG